MEISRAIGEVLGLSALGFGAMVAVYNYRIFIHRYFRKEINGQFSESGIPLVCTILLLMAVELLKIDTGKWLLPILLLLDPLTFISLGFGIYSFLAGKLSK